MPVIKVQRVVSCSSEDRVHNSENMLVSDHYRKWKSAQSGEKQITILLQLEKSSVIHSVDIGNEASAFVEVLVGRSSDTKQDFQVLLVSSSFMTPAESRQNSNTNRVRMFGPEKLSLAVSKEKWDLVKIVCTQPFDKTIQYGLSFIVFHSPPEKNEDIKPDPDEQTSLGAFKIKNSDESDDNIRVGSWFAKRKSDSQEVDTSSSPSAIKAATVKRTETLLTGNATKKMKLSSGDNDKSDQSTSNGAVSFTKNKDHNREIKQESKETKKIANPEVSKPTTSGANFTKTQSKKIPDVPAVKTNNKQTSFTTSQSSGNHKRPPKRDIPFHKLLEGTVFALSGYQNPKRGNIRDKAIEMGAVYKPDWDKQCTHLICAFLNTPKFQQVHSKGGRIVKESWIFECSKQKKRLPWRQFMLGKSNRPASSESEDSDPEDRRSNSPRPKPGSTVQTTPVSKPARTVNPGKNADAHQLMANKRSSSPSDTPSTSSFKTASNTPSTSSFKTASNTPSRIVRSKSPSPVADELDSDAAYNADTDADTDSGCDTETEISKVIAKKKAENSDIKKDVNTGSLDLPQLPDIFQGEHFYMYGDFSDGEKKRLTRYVIGCGGLIEEYMGNNVLCVLTNSKWKQEFTEAISENSSLRILKPSWVSDCIDQGKLLPKKDYFVHRR